MRRRAEVFHGKPCGKCGSTERYVATKQCRPCLIKACARWRARKRPRKQPFRGLLAEEQRAGRGAGLTRFISEHRCQNCGGRERYASSSRCCRCHRERKIEPTAERREQRSPEIYLRTVPLPWELRAV